MKHTYSITGMTCEGCKASVTQALNAMDSIQEVEVYHSKGEAVISMSSHVATSELQKAIIIIMASYMIFKTAVL